MSEHNTLGNQVAAMHGLLWQTVANAAALLALNITQADVDQMKLVLQTDTGEVWFPQTTGVGATFARVITTADPAYAGDAVRLYGDASDVDLTITGSDVTYNAEKNYGTISWGVGATGRLLVPASAVAGFAIKCRVLDFTNGFAGCIQSNGIAGGAGAAQTTGGTAGTTRTLVDNAQIGAGVSGAVGGASSATNGIAGTNGSNITFANGGVGGASGTGGNGAGGSGAGSKTGGTVTLGRRIKAAVLPEDLDAGVAGSTGSARQLQGGASGGSGSGGAGDGTTQGGGGGGGGGGAPVLAIYAQRWIMPASPVAGMIQCKGGNGGNGGTPAAGNRGGGAGAGGGGGGYIYACGDVFIGTCANLFDASGGNGGNGGSGAGSGTAGTGGAGAGGGCIDVIQRGIGRIAQATGTTGSAASGSTGGAGEVTRVGI